MKVKNDPEFQGCKYPNEVYAISFYRTINMKLSNVKVISIIGRDVFHLIN